MGTTDTLDNPQAMHCRRTKAIVSLFAILYLSTTFLMACPRQWSQIRLLLLPVEPFCQYIGIWSDLSLFSPNPWRTVKHPVCLLHFKDGTTEIWQYPRANSFIWDRPLFERYYLLFLRSLVGMPATADAFAAYVVGEAATAERCPDYVDLLVTSTAIPPADASSAAAGERDVLIRRYQVRPQDIRWRTKQQSHIMLQSIERKDRLQAKG